MSKAIVSSFKNFDEAGALKQSRQLALVVLSGARSQAYFHQMVRQFVDGNKFSTKKAAKIATREYAVELVRKALPEAERAMDAMANHRVKMSVANLQVKPPIIDVNWTKDYVEQGEACLMGVKADLIDVKAAHSALMGLLADLEKVRRALV